MQPLIDKARGNPAVRQQLRQNAIEDIRDARQRLVQVLTPDQREQLRELMLASAASSTPGSGKTASATEAAVEHERAPAAGQAAPAFSLATPDGRTVSLGDFRDKPLVLVFGCLTDPSFREHAAALQAMQAENRASASFLVIYTRELHPVGGWEIQRNKDDGISVAQPADAAGRLAAARSAQSSLKLSVPIAIDTMDDRTAHSYDAAEGAALIIASDGRIIYRQNHFQPEGLGNALVQATGP